MADALYDQYGGYNVTVTHWGPQAAGVGLDTGAAGITASASFMPVAATYGANDIIAAPQEFVFSFSDGTLVPNGSLIRVLTTVLKIDATALVASEAAYSLYLYSVTPPSAQLDNDPWTLASADLPSYRGLIGLGTPSDLGSACYVKVPGIDTDIKLAGNSVFGRLVTVPGFVIPAVARQVLLYGVVL